MAHFTNILATRADGERLSYGAGVYPITPEIDAALTAAIPPPPPPPPPVPSMQMVVPPDMSAVNRGHGIELKMMAGTSNPVALYDRMVKGFAQNVVIENVAADVILDNVRSSLAWHDEPTPQNARTFEGQPFYLNNCGRVLMRGCAGYQSGWLPGKPAGRRSMYLHGCYQNVGCKFLSVQWSAFGAVPNAGIEFKGNGQIQDSLLFDCGTGLLCLKGPLDVRRCVILDGHRYAAGVDSNGPTSWTGDVAVQTYGAVSLEDVAIIGGPLQNAPDLTTAKSSDMGALNGSKTYNGTLEDGSHVPGASWSCNRVYECNWRGPTLSGDVQPATDPITDWAPAAVPSVPDVIARLNNPAIPVRDTVMWVFQMMKVPWLNAYK